ncbi:MAG: nucleotidyltransferase family protein [Crenarchaeota archaeon]|nr:nucleotidyltransferase family protein [Thermoproteota archaeon]
MKALILAGGYGKRLKPLTDEIPKPLIEVAGKPILGWQIELYKKHGINEIVLAVGHLKEKIMEKVGSGSKYGVKAVYVVEDKPLGTGGAIKNAEVVLRSEPMFVASNGDIITNLDVSKLCKALEGSGAVAAMSLVPLPSPYGVVIADESGRVREFKEKPKIPDYWINAGIYCMKPEIFEYLPESGDVEKTAFPQLAKEGKLIAVKYPEAFWKSIDNFKDLEEASKVLSELNLF